jgi:hypothetical protein
MITEHPTELHYDTYKIILFFSIGFISVYLITYILKKIQNK